MSREDRGWQGLLNLPDAAVCIWGKSNSHQILGNFLAVLGQLLALNIPGQWYVLLVQGKVRKRFMPNSIWIFLGQTPEASIKKCNYLGVSFLPAEELCFSVSCS